MGLLVCLVLGCPAIAQGAQAQQQNPTALPEPLTGFLDGAAEVGQLLVGHTVSGAENVLSRAEKRIQSLFPLKQTSISTRLAATTTPVILTSTPPSTPGAPSTTALASTLPPTTTIAVVASTPPPTTAAASTTASTSSTPLPTTPATSTTTSTSSTVPSTTVAVSTSSIPPPTTQAATTQPPSTTQTPLQGYTVLAAGGFNFEAGILNSSELYTNIAGNWAAMGAMTTPRAVFNMVRLLNGEALLAGGFINQGDPDGDNPGTNITEAYNATSGSWAETGEMTTPRTYFQMVTLQVGAILAAGGCVDGTDDTTCDTQASAEVFNTSTGMWNPTGSMMTPRREFQMVALPDGTALAAGGNAVFPDGASGLKTVYFNSSEIYDPMTGNWTSTGSMSTSRSNFQMVLLPDGKVLAAGGIPNDTVPVQSLSSLEIYDPATGLWTATGSMLSGRVQFQLVRLLSGNVLAASGVEFPATSYLNSTEVYDYSTGTWNATGAMYTPPGQTPRFDFSMVALPDGNALAAGGFTVLANTDFLVLDTCEVYSPATGNWTETSSLTTASAYLGMVLL
ncbi:probable Kelch-like protein 17 [Coccomyxa sp. Obi]|nr:probable Kelch-like protein 17 [Coccomyxa sp. Obi]